MSHEAPPSAHSSSRDPVRRTHLRRKADRGARRQHEQLKILLELGQIVTSEMNLDALFGVIIEQANRFMGTERGSLFLFDAEHDQLWSFIASGLGQNEIRIPAGSGAAGWAFRQAQPLIINDVYKDPRFLDKVDQHTGFRTRNLLCIPVINRGNDCIAVLQVLNKTSGEFEEADVEFLAAASHYIAIALENAKLYEDLKVLDKAKERVINHLSHELKTPLAILTSVLKKISKELEGASIAGLDRTLDRGQRNLRRLMELQEKIDDILKHKSRDEQGALVAIIESTADLVRSFADTDGGAHTEVLERISSRLEELFFGAQGHKELVDLRELLNGLCDEAIARMGKRELRIVSVFDRGIQLVIDRKVLEKVIGGLLRNAIENTPDQGKIEITATRRSTSARIEIHDYGVGITQENQGMIFGGFFHTQSTENYASKRPYEFNAGGSGSDLLRIKALTTANGFAVDCKSTRCRYLSTDSDVCPGRISQCAFVKQASQCQSSGESTFWVDIPLAPAANGGAANGIAAKLRI